MGPSQVETVSVNHGVGNESIQAFKAFQSGMRKTSKKRSKRVFLLSFLDPGLPKQASGSPRPSEDFSLEEPAHMGKPITSGVSLGSPWRDAMVLNVFFFYK